MIIVGGWKKRIFQKSFAESLRVSVLHSEGKRRRKPDECKQKGLVINFCTTEIHLCTLVCSLYKTSNSS